MLTDRGQETRTLPYLSQSIEIVPKETITEKLLVVHRHLDILKKKQDNDMTHYDKLFSQLEQRHLELDKSIEKTKEMLEKIKDD